MRRIILFAVVTFIANQAFAQNLWQVDSLEKALQVETSERQKVDIHNKIAEAYQYFDSTKVVVHAQKAIELAQKIDYLQGVADAHYLTGYVVMEKGYYQEALREFQEVLSISEKISYAKGKGQAYNGFGEVYRNEGLYAQALDFYFRALRIDQEQNNTLGVIKRHLNIATTITSQGRSEEALKSWKKVLLVLEQLNHPIWTATSCTQIGTIYAEKQNFDKALYYLNKAKVVVRQIKGKESAFLYENLGRICLSLKKYKEALGHFHNARKKYQQANRKPDMARNCILQGKTYIALKNYSEALRYLHQGLQMAQSIHSMNNMKVGAEILADTYEILGKDKEAIRFHKLFRQTIEKLNHEENTAKLLVVKTKYRLEKEEATIRREKEAQITGLRNIIVVLVVLVLLAFWIIQTRNNRKLKQINQRTQFVNVSLASALETSKKQRQKIRLQNNKIRQAYQHVQDTNAALEDALAISEHQQNKIKLQNRQIQQVNSTLEEALQTSKRQQTKIGLQHKKIEEAYRNTQYLASIGQKITSSLDLNQVLKDIYEEIRQLMDMTAFEIGSYSAESQTIIPRLIVNDNEITELSKEMSHNYSNSIATWCIKHKQPLIMSNVLQEIHNYVADFQEESFLQNGGFSEMPVSVMYMPLTSKDKVIGIIAIHSNKKHAYSGQHFNLFKNLSTYVSISVENASVHQQMEQKNKQLKELDQFKRQAVNMIAHDLKNPLSNIRGLSDEAPEYSPMYRIHQASIHMERMIINMLDTQRLEEAKLQPNQELQKVEVLTHQAVNQVMTIAKEKDIEISLNVGVAQILADRELTQRVLINLLNNAVKYSPVNSRITIETEIVEQKFVRFSVTDDGKGIPESALGKIFDKFYQVRNDVVSKRYYSTGIGLSFCKLAVEAQQGTIGVKSVLKQGSTFWFTLPLAGKKEDVLASKTALVSETEKVPVLLLSKNDKQKLKPWLAMLSQYQVYQLSKIKAILQEMNFRKNTALHAWKQKMEQALYHSNEEAFRALIS